MTTEEYKAIKSAAQAVGFYDAPLLHWNSQIPDYYDLFEWHPWSQDGTTRIGSLKEEFFDTIDKKITYLQGIFENESEGYGIIHGENWIQFANSCEKAERCKKWINEIARGVVSSDGNIILNGILSHNIEYTYPLCHQIKIHHDVIKFIKEYKNAEEET